MAKRRGLDPDIRPPTPAERKYIHRLENPYAVLSIALPSKALRSVSARTFETECARILRQYIPQAENGGLRPHHRHFIERNRVKQPLLRGRILELLQRYDLGAPLRLQGQFNREPVDFSDDKLQQIEKDAALDSEGQ